MIEDLTACFDGLVDPRVTRQCDHRLIDILVIAVCAVIACAESWEDIALYGRSKQAWLTTFLALANGIPSHDTFRRVFMLIDPDAFEGCFTRWAQSFAVRSSARWWRSTARPSDALAVAATITGRCIWSAPGQAIKGWCSASARSTASRTRSPPSPSCSIRCILTAPS